VASAQALEHRACFDDLTGLVNRSEMLERFRILLTPRPGRVPMAFLLVDIDQFKHINATYGPAGGDCVLKLWRSGSIKRCASMIGCPYCWR